MVYLSDRVMRSAFGAKAVAARQEIRLENRFQHHLEGGLDHSVAHGSDAKPAALATGLGDHHFPYRLRVKPPCLETFSQLGEESLLATDSGDVMGASGSSS